VNASKVDERPDGSLAFYRLARDVLAGLCHLLFRVKVVGKDKVPASGAFVVAPTHRSIVDIPLTATITRRRLRFMGKQELWGTRFGAWLFTSLGGFAVDRTAGTGAARAALARLAGGEPVVLFPEGTRRSGPRVEDLQGGAAYLAVKAGVPILPVGIAGSEEIMPSGSPLIRPRRVAVVVGDLITPAPGTSTGRARKEEIAALSARLEDTLQRLFDDAFAVLGQPRHD
jgi:1-acyl-sn-glycerol-3-phosphate acyltransferase